MSITFSGGELINIAINIENCGIAFYDTMTRTTENTDARAVFRYLADMEKQHAKTFRDMAGKAELAKIPGADSEEYQGYLQALVDSAVFSDELTSSELASRVGSDIEALELGIEAEKDSILFYYEMRGMVPAHTQTVIDRIIGEEKAHLKQLSDIKKKLAELK
ncbi:MAG: ferritin family protein [Dehalococcoidales bacterium]|nr:ferritin family protein [Dehalococcoidales bacterium]